MKKMNKNISLMVIGTLPKPREKNISQRFLRELFNATKKGETYCGKIEYKSKWVESSNCPQCGNWRKYRDNRCWCPQCGFIGNKLQLTEDGLIYVVKQIKNPEKLFKKLL